MAVWLGFSTTGTQNEFWKEVSQEKDPVENQGISMKKSCGRMPPNCLNTKNLRTAAKHGVTAARNNVRAWSRNEP